MICRSQASSAFWFRQRSLHALSALSFACVALYWASQASIDPASAQGGESRATVSDALMALAHGLERYAQALVSAVHWGGSFAYGLMSTLVRAHSASGKQSRNTFSPAQRIPRPQFSRISVRAFWSRTFADMYAATRPVTGRVMGWVQPARVAAAATAAAEAQLRSSCRSAAARRPAARCLATSGDRHIHRLHF